MLQHKTQMTRYFILALFLFVTIALSSCTSSISGDTQTVPVSPTITPTNTLTPTATQTFTITPSPTLTLTPTRTPIPTRTPTPTITPSPTPQRLAYEPITPDNVNELRLLVDKAGGRFVSFVNDQEFALLSDNNVCVLNAFSPYTEECASYPNEYQNIYNRYISPDLSTIIGSDFEGNLYVWDRETRKLLHTIKTPRTSTDWRTWRIGLVADKYVVFGYKNDDKVYNAYLWSLDLQKTEKIFEDRVYYVQGGNYPYSEDGKLIALFKNNDYSDNIIEVWETQDLSLKLEIKLFDKISCVSFSPNGKLLVVIGSKEPIIHIYRIEDGKHLFVARGEGRRITDFAFSNDGTLFTFVSAKKSILIWETENWTLNRILSANPPYGYSDVIFSPDSKMLLASPDSSHRLTFAAPIETNYVWDIETGKILGRLLGRQACLLGGFSPNSDYLVLTSYDEITTYRTTDMEVISRRVNEYGRPLEFSSDGKLLASGARGGSVLLWSTQDGSFMREFVPIDDYTETWYENDSFELPDFDMSPDEKYKCNKKRVWAREYYSISRLLRLVYYSPCDNAYLQIYRNNDQGELLFEIPIGMLYGNNGGVDIAFAPDDTMVAITHGEGINKRFQIWGIPPSGPHSLDGEE